MISTRSGRAEPILLDDARMQHFIDRGHLTLQAAYRLALNGSGLPALADALTGEDDAARPAAATGLAAAGEAAAGFLAPALDDARPEVRRMATAALGEIGPGAIEVAADLQARLADDDGEVRQRAARSLGLVGAGGSVPALEDALQDRDEQVREHAAEALGFLTRGTDRAVAPLAGALHDSARYVRGAAAEALRSIGTARSTERLLDYLAVARWCPITTRESPY